MKTKIKAIGFCLIAFGLLAGSYAYSQATVIYPLANIKMRSITLQPMIDGGCEVSVSGTAFSSDGGNSLQLGVRGFQVQRPIFQARCIALLQAGQVLLATQLGMGDGGQP